MGIGFEKKILNSIPENLNIYNVEERNKKGWDAESTKEREKFGLKCF
jgi:hypothetical protein